MQKEMLLNHYDVSATYTNKGVLQTNFYTTVFDETGRPVSRASSIDIFTQDVFFGIKKGLVLLLPAEPAGEDST